MSTTLNVASIYFLFHFLKDLGFLHVYLSVVLNFNSELVLADFPFYFVVSFPIFIFLNRNERIMAI